MVGLKGEYTFNEAGLAAPRVEGGVDAAADPGPVLRTLCARLRLLGARLARERVLTCLHL